MTRTIHPTVLGHRCRFWSRAPSICVHECGGLFGRYDAIASLEKSGYECHTRAGLTRGVALVGMGRNNEGSKGLPYLYEQF